MKGACRPRAISRPFASADGPADQQRQGERRKALTALGGERREDGSEREHRAAGQVDAATDDDERHADCHKAQERACLDDVQEVVHAREARPEREATR